jgi:hypothetical protein
MIFMFRLISDGEKCSKKMGSEEHEPYAEAIKVFRDADRRRTEQYDNGPGAAGRAPCTKSDHFLEWPFGSSGQLGCAQPVRRARAPIRPTMQCQTTAIPRVFLGTYPPVQLV